MVDNFKIGDEVKYFSTDKLRVAKGEITKINDDGQCELYVEEFEYMVVGIHKDELRNVELN